MTIQDRLAAREAQPALLRLDTALSQLAGCLTVMNTGAHPDDEHSGLMAWLRFGLGHRVVIACSTRGEGGQNALGPERGALLGVLRSREMEEAARVLDCDVAWLGFGPADPVHDFGFSKDGDDTFSRWGEALITERLALAYRRYRPDVILPTFLDVPGQHGHHRAMTRAALAAVALAADPAALRGSNLAPWQVSHPYLPAWGGGGGTYDDTLPPPPATLQIEADAMEPARGVSYEEIGQWSRRRHASQGMGHWSDSPQRTWQLHLTNGGTERRLAEGVPATLSELAELSGPAAAPLRDAAEAIEAARAAFPDRVALLPALARADSALAAARTAAAPDFATAHGHRLERKQRELAHALAEAASLTPVATIRPARLSPGETARISLHQTVPMRAEEVSVSARLPGCPEAGSALSEGLTEIALPLPADLALPSPFTEGFDALGGNGAHLSISAVIAGRPVSVLRDIEPAPQIVPAHLVAARPAAFVRRLGAAGPLSATLSIETALSIDAPAGWSLSQQGRQLSLIPEADTPGLASFTPRIEGAPAFSESGGAYAHTGAFLLHTPARIDVLSLDLALPEGARIAYIGSGDSVGSWLQRLGADVVLMEDIPADEDFSAFTTVLVGVVAFGNRADLRAATARLHRFVEAGGHLVTLYQRPDQGWQADETPPQPMRIGTPSLRWRVTDPRAEVTVLEPESPLLTTPNRITPADWDGWDKERGLYFAADWAPCYQPLLSMSDAGEAPLLGSLVSGRIGKGRHTHTGLVLHHQLDRLVPGAFRLLANLVQPAGA
ncbi:PIG-L family deacetylase [Oceanicola sp. S124]|uniref:PIG-L family deacetylase n=1 Tax=Oceanicola sp. S124 TaxID=1042378 RepID=UPI000255A98B|nr:PIG-L family deacetylase [Oceanicola sp. S124]